MKEFSLLIKPSSADCNMRCRYCFYLKKSALYPDRKVHRMSESTLEQLVSSYMNTGQNYYNFIWQGGEPTLMGTGFYKKVIELQKKYGKAGSKVTNNLQTNGTLIDNNLAGFLSENKFLVGVSFDGPEYIHDHYRVFPGGRGTFKKVMKGIEILKKNNVNFNILVLVNDFNINKIEEIYRFMVSNSYYFHQYIPCVEFDSNGNLQPFSINGEQWGNFLIKLFDLWYRDDMHKVSIGLFDSIINYIINGKSTICYMGNNCNHYLVVEHNGDVYPCDFFVSEDLKLGNINENSWGELINNKTYINFSRAKSEYSFICNSCKYLEYCYGDCLKNRGFNFKNPDSSRRLSILCSGWKIFYKEKLNLLKEISLNPYNISV